MDEVKSIIYSKPVVEFVAVAKEFCVFLSGIENLTQSEFIDKIQKFIPLIYLKGSMLPYIDSFEEGECEDVVTEDEYNTLFALVKLKMGEFDDYLEIFDEAEGYRDEPVVNTVSEKVADIYQDIKNFVHSYRSGVDSIMSEALWTLNNNFDLYWGKSCADVLRAIHVAKCRCY